MLEGKPEVYQICLCCPYWAHDAIHMLANQCIMYLNSQIFFKVFPLSMNLNNLIILCHREDFFMVCVCAHFKCH